MNALHDAPPLIDVATARDMALAQVRVLSLERDVPLGLASGQVCARDVTATRAMPFFTNSAVDGFALRLSDLTGAPCVLPVAGTVAAGTAGPRDLPAAAALRIFTGAPLPAGADCVAPIEGVTESNGTIRLDAPPAPGANIRTQGSDQPAGACLLARGTRIAPQHVGLLAANGIAQVTVARTPRVVVLSTGDEVTSGAGSRAGQVFDANRPMLLALARAAGAEAVDGGIMPDAVEPLARCLVELAASADLVLTSGGISLGGRDPIRPAFTRAGGLIAGWRVAVKPGKPVMFGRIHKAAFTGLPGNPMAAFVGFHLFVSPQIARLAGRTPAPFAPFKARAAFSWHRRPGRQEVFPVRRTGTDDTGLPLLERLGDGVSATLYPLAGAEGLGSVPARSEGVSPGDLIDWHPFGTGG
jgi:molybdopterin molybdotransferase